jgi:hypothetical protein
MKSCPTCNRTYPDDTLAFCLMDGAVLSAPYDPAENRAAPRPSNEPPPTEVITAPAKPAEARAPLQSTIRAPVPQVPDLKPSETVAPQSHPSIAVPLMFRLPLAARGILAVLFIIPWIFVDHGGWMWNALYPLLAGALAIAAGVSLYPKFRTGRLLVVDGIVAVIMGIVILLSDRMWSYAHGTWPLVSGVLLIAAAVELRKHLTRTWLLGLAGGIFMPYTICKAAIFYRSRHLDSNFPINFLIAMVYIEAAVAFAYGVMLAVFSFVTRARNLSESN